jgi:hypothetical protein
MSFRSIFFVIVAALATAPSWAQSDSAGPVVEKPRLPIPIDDEMCRNDRISSISRVLLSCCHRAYSNIYILPA